MAEPQVSDMSQYLTAVRRQLQFYLRTWRFIGLLVFVAVVSAAVLGVQAYLGVANVASGSTPAKYLSGYLGEIGTVVVLVAAFLGGDAIAMDFGSATGYFLLVQPVRRVVLLLGRFTAAVLAAAVIGGVYLLFAIGGTLAFFGTAGFPVVGFGYAIGLLLLFLLGAVAVAFFFSALFKTPAVSLIVTILTLWLGFSLVTGVLELANIEPWFSILYAGDGVSLVVLPTYAHSAPLGIISGTIYEPYPWESAVISSAYFVVFLVLSVVLYNAKEVKG